MITTKISDTNNFYQFVVSKSISINLAMTIQSTQPSIIISITYTAVTLVK